jgi:elongation factor 2
VQAGAGELHLEVLLHSVEEIHHIKVISSEPMVSFRESVTMTSTQLALKKSANKLNRVWFEASPLSAELVEEMDSGRLECTDLKTMARELVERHGWDRNSARRVWAVGPEPLVAFAKQDAGDSDAIGQPTCILVNSTTGLQIPGDVRDTIVTAFKRVCREGVLAGEQLHGVRFDLIDGEMFCKAIINICFSPLALKNPSFLTAFMYSCL